MGKKTADPEGMACEACAFYGITTMIGVALEDARTRYHHAPCEHEDCLEVPEMRLLCFEARDPNKPVALCRACAAEHHARWDEQWNSYYAGLL